MRLCRNCSSPGERAMMTSQLNSLWPGVLMAIAVVGVATGQSATNQNPSLEQVETLLTEQAATITSIRSDIVFESEGQGLGTAMVGTLQARSARDTWDWRLDLATDVVDGSQTAEEESLAQGTEQKKDDYLSTAYVPAKSNFVLGYLLGGVASKALGRNDEAKDRFDEALRFNPRLKGLVETLQSDTYNLLLVVGYGKGPAKIAYGPDNALAMFVPSQEFLSTRDVLICRYDTERVTAPVVCDVNVMAQDHMWNNLEDVRLAKSIIGTLITSTGASMAASGQDNSAYIGLAVMVIGLAVKASAHADTRYCEAMPQRFYVVPLNLTAPDTTIQLQVAGRPDSKMVLMGLGPPEKPKIMLRYVFLMPGPQTAGWAASEEIHYANDSYSGHVGGDDLPYILGGHCVCHPTEEVLARYQAAGHLQGMTLSQLEDLYRAEKIKLSLLEEEGGRAGLHILEGGISLECPIAGSAGFKRLFCQEHPPYEPKSQLVKDLAAQIRQTSATSQVASVNSRD